MREGGSPPKFSPDGKWIAFESRTQDGATTPRTRASSRRARSSGSSAASTARTGSFDRPKHIYVAPVDGTGTPRNLTPGTFQHGGVSWLPDSSAIVTSAQRHDTWDLDFADDLYSVALAGPDEERIQALTSQTGVYGYPSVSPNGEHVAFIGADDPSTNPQNFHVGLVR